MSAQLLLVEDQQLESGTRFRSASTYYPISLRRARPASPSKPLPISSNEDGSGAGLAVPLISTRSPVAMPSPPPKSLLVTMKSRVLTPGWNPPVMSNASKAPESGIR